ncbi:GNAT family N-acetyltransferase [uncultured Microscilla sp.]|uniref:GNAT family N-acetyltransferase n=1 Tax=uncultured Microscilla sp. TaxID=432653 RepID=UPI0026372578|nr:GNAT family N-acetyltransferase [uncultured Microscilla sp.]
MHHIQIIEYQNQYRQQIIDMVLHIQQKEFGSTITLDDQPDLSDIPAFCEKWNGKFWLAINAEAQVVGTIALLDIGNRWAALRKMFVREDHRGKTFGVGLALLNGLFAWAIHQGIQEVFLGTTAWFLAAHRFYEKNGFIEIPKDSLPTSFPAMDLDVKFYRKYLDVSAQT